MNFIERIPTLDPVEKFVAASMVICVILTAAIFIFVAWKELTR